LPPTPQEAIGRASLYLWRFRDISLVADRRGAWSFSVTAEGAATARGVGIGSELAQVKRTYEGLDCGTANEGTEYVQFPYCTGRVAEDRYIWFGEDPVKSITVSIAPLQ
jgi:hypothetical protein